MFTVYQVSGKDDGKELNTFDSIDAARKFAESFESDPNNDLNPTWGGTMILDDAGALWF